MGFNRPIAVLGDYAAVLLDSDDGGLLTQIRVNQVTVLQNCGGKAS